MEKVTKLALTSRIIVLVLQLFANAALPDHKSDVFRSPNNVTYAASTLSNTTDFDGSQASTATWTWLDKTVHYCLGGLRHWDGEYFLHIAEYTYTYENTLAFYPLYPMVVRICAHTLHFFGLGLSLRSWSLLVAVLLNLYCFCKATSMLYNLTQRIFNDLNKSWNAALLFCVNPASIFFTAAYSEALYCWITMYLMLQCATNLNFVYTTVALALSVISRSNGLVNIGFPIYFTLRKILWTSYSYFSIVKLIFSQLCALVPLTFFYFYAFQQFCLTDNEINHPPEIVAYGHERHYILAGQRHTENSPWCDDTLPFPYSYIQSHYWNVGFLRYYEFKQLPNFLLALPVLWFLYYHCFKYLKHFFWTLLPRYPIKPLLKEYKSLPFVLHALFLTAFCTFFVHIQISTRLLCSASPCLYWFAADYLPKTFDQLKLRSKASLILIWFGLYCVVGTVLFSNNLPWT